MDKMHPANSNDTATWPISVSMADAAKLTGLCRSSLYNHARRGALPLRKVGGKTLVMVEDLQRLIRGEAA